MRFLFQFLLVMSCLPALGQTDTSYRMTVEQNNAWLIKVKESSKETKLALIKLRLIERRHEVDRTNELMAPILIIDGIQITENIAQNEKDFLRIHLKVEIVDILILENEILIPGHYQNDVIVLTIKDKKVSKDFFNLGRKPRKKRS